MDFRVATISDLKIISNLDKKVFGGSGKDLEPAGDNELLMGIQRSQIWVAEVEDAVVGFIQIEKVESERFLLISLAVNPKMQGIGVGRALLNFAIEHLVTPRCEVSCVTSPRNSRMISLLLSSGFRGTALVQNYFGKGKDRLTFHYTADGPEYRQDGHFYLPLTSSEAIEQLMNAQDYHLVQFHKGAQGDMVELAVQIRPDVVGLRQTEANTSVGQASGVLAALTFLLGFSFVSEAFSTPLRIFVLVGAVLTLGAMQMYANSTGNMSRIGDGNFDNHMKWGNILLDYGGHYPLVLTLPAVFAYSTESFGVSLGVGVIVSSLLVIYELSPYSIFRRLPKNGMAYTLMIATCLMPVLATPMTYFFATQMAWVITAAIVITLRALVQTRLAEVGHK